MEEITGLYVRFNESLYPIESWDKVKELWEDTARASVKVDIFNVGYHGYSLEFIFDGSFLYPVDRDDLDFKNGEQDFVSLDGLEQLMQSHGDMYKKFLNELAGEIPISNASNNDDFFVYELREKSLNDIISGVTGKFLTLYPEDFEKTHEWEAVCQHLGIDFSSASVDVYYTKLAVAGCNAS